MATAQKSRAETPVSTPPELPPGAFSVGILRVYKFLASLTLAACSITTLAAALAVGTYVESRYGAKASQAWVYKSPAFSVLLAFLATNILCAATIRYPWKRRQTGFVITHAGLLILIFGSWWSFRTGLEGRVGMLEGQQTNELILEDESAIRVREIDPAHAAHAGRSNHTEAAISEYLLPFNGGILDWPEGKYQVVSQPKTPFKLAVKRYFRSSIPVLERVPDPSGVPMVMIRPRIRAPQAPDFSDVFPSESRQWFMVPDNTRLERVVKDAGPAKFVFQYVDRMELVDDFLNFPKNTGKEGIARFRYQDKAGKLRSHDVILDSIIGKTDPIALPESDLTAVLDKVDHVPVTDESMREALGQDLLSVAKFKVRKGSGEFVEHTGFASMPMIPSIIPGPDGKSATPLLEVQYLLAPELSGGNGRMGGSFGVVEVMGDPAGRLYYRVFGRDESIKPDAPGPRRGIVRSSGALKPGEEVTAFGGNPNMPMTMVFSARNFYPAGIEREIAQSFDLPVGKKDEALSAAKVEMTVDGETKEFWVRRPPALSPEFQTVSFAKKTYQVAFDCVRKDLGFTLKLHDFEVGFDPGTKQPSSFRSDVTLTDEAKGVKDKPIVISMNEPLTHGGWTFYQSSYNRARDPVTRQDTGEFQSIFQVARDPGNPIKYFGCVLIVLGAFMQFYMRAGVFTAGGAKDRERAESPRGPGKSKVLNAAGTRPVESSFEPL